MAEQNLWQTICNITDLVDNAGICALLANDEQVAIFSLPNEPEQVFALNNYDPFGKANVLYRGIVGCNQGTPMVASPLYKQQFSLKTGQCLQEDVAIKAYPVRISGQEVQILV